MTTRTKPNLAHLTRAAGTSIALALVHVGLIACNEGSRDHDAGLGNPDSGFETPWADEDAGHDAPRTGVTRDSETPGVTGSDLKPRVSAAQLAVAPTVVTRAPAVTARLEEAPVAEASQVADPTESGRRAWTTDLALTADTGGLHAMLGAADSDALEFGHGDLRLFDRTSYIVHATVPDGAVPTHARTWKDRRVEVLTDQGDWCDATVVRLEYRVSIIPDYYEVEVWNGRDEEGEQVHRPLRGQALAQEIWKGGYPELTARLRLVDPASCSGHPVVAKKSDAPTPKVATPAGFVPRRRAVMAAFRSLPAYQANQAEYDTLENVRGPDSPKRWERFHAVPVVRAFDAPGEHDTLVSVSIPFAHCGNWGPALWAVFRVDARSKMRPELVHLSQDHGPEDVKLIVAPGSDSPDFVVETGLSTTVVRGESNLTDWGPSFHGCRC